jgi:succinate-semialdehyde dehydrogenase/glutarate-semialdehyde dehydrogenase
MTSAVPALDATRLELLARRARCDARSLPSLQVRAASTGELLGVLPASNPADLSVAVAAAAEAQRPWGAMPAYFRRAVFERAAKLTLANRDHLTGVLQAETGCDRDVAEAEVAEVARAFRKLPRALVRQVRRGVVREPVGAFLHPDESRRPIGVVGVLAGRIRPFATPAVASLEALMAGNAVVCKPGSGTACTSLVLGELLDAARLPDDLFQVLLGPGPRLGAALVGEVDHIVFSGSPGTARAVGVQCADRRIGCSAR